MLGLKQCECGCNHFYDDCGTMRCENCDAIAKIMVIKDKEKDDD